MARMLGNIIGRTCFPYDDFYPRSWKQELVRLQRSRERNALEHEWFEEMRAVEPWDFGDDNAPRSHEVWRADVENDAGMRFVEFDGTYTVPSETFKQT